MKKIFIVKVRYDYESHMIAGVFDNEEVANNVSDLYNSQDEVLDGCYIEEELFFSSFEQWDKQFDDE